MKYTRALALSLILCCTNALCSPMIRNDNNYHPPTEDVRNQEQIIDKNESKIIKIQENKNESIAVIEKDTDPLKSFIDSVIKNKVIEVKKEENITVDKNNNRVKKMQKMANYISEQYNVPMSNAEKIVYSTFVEADKQNLDPALVLSLIHTESTFQQFTKSRSGAVGLTQIIPRVHKEKIGELLKEKKDIWSITGNIRVGTQILKEYVDLAGGNIRKALQMYNGSSHDIKYKYSNKIIAKMNTFNTVLSTL